MEEHVWEFTNQRKLKKSEFLDFFERKIFRTIRKFNMLPKDKIISLKKEDTLNTAVLKSILETKFKVIFSNSPNFSSNNLSYFAEKIFENVLKGNFKGKGPSDSPFCPLYFLSDKEIELYAKLKNIKGKKRKLNEQVQKLFSKFQKKNQDLEQNIINAFFQL